MPELQSRRTRVRRMAERGRYDEQTVHAIIDEALYCHVGFIFDGHPFVVPTIHGRRGSTVYVHGSGGSRMLRAVSQLPMCLAVTLLDGLVLARSAFDHSMNYRAVTLIGNGRPVTVLEEKMIALETISEHVAPGRWGEVRHPSPRELAATAVVALAIEEGSAKIRSGPAEDAAESCDIWSGILPLSIVALPPIPDQTARQLAVPASVQHWARRRRAMHANEHVEED